MIRAKARITAALIVGVATLCALGLDRVVDDTRICGREYIYEGNVVTISDLPLSAAYACPEDDLFACYESTLVVTAGFVDSGVYRGELHGFAC